MPTRTWLTLAFIILLALVSVWIDLPGSGYDIAGIRANHPIREGLDLQGGLQVVLQAQPVAGKTLDREALEGTRQTLERRINSLGVSEPLIQTRGNDQIIVELPGVANPQDAINIMQQTALLEIIDPQGRYLPPGTIVNTTLGPAKSPEEGTRSRDAGGVAGRLAASDPRRGRRGNTDLRRLGDTRRQRGRSQRPRLSDDHQRRRSQERIRHHRRHWSEPGRRLRAPGRRGDQVLPVHQQPSRSTDVDRHRQDRHLVAPDQRRDLHSRHYRGRSTGGSRKPCHSAQGRRAGSAAGSCAESTVGPTLGQDSVDKSILAGVIGLGIVCLFMILYYRLPGAVSVLALFIYTAVVFAIFKLIPVTLTLAGIAGFILSIGMAVDANVLIFSRIKEEVRQRRPMTQAIELGFSHAWPSIRDSNITTMITTFILYLFGNYTGTSIITGFALTLFIGVVVSMFTAITVTRTLLRVVVAAGLTNRTLVVRRRPLSPRLSLQPAP